MVTSGLHIVAAMVSIVLFLIYRDIALRSGREACRIIGTAMGLVLLITAYLIGRAYLPTFGPLMTVAVVVVWITIGLVSELYFIERPLRAQHAKEH